MASAKNRCKTKCNPQCSQTWMTRDITCYTSGSLGCHPLWTTLWSTVNYIYSYISFLPKPYENQGPYSRNDSTFHSIFIKVACHLVFLSLFFVFKIQMACKKNRFTITTSCCINNETSNFPSIAFGHSDRKKPALTGRAFENILKRPSKVVTNAFLKKSQKTF
jgi:hypothetical protein